MKVRLPYCQDNPLRISWLRGWGFASSHEYAGEVGKLHEFDNSLKKSSLPTKAKREKKVKPLPDQTSFLDGDLNTDLQLIKNNLGSLFETSLKNHPVKKRYKNKNF